jgi:hypothetical protein
MSFIDAKTPQSGGSQPESFITRDSVNKTELIIQAYENSINVDQEILELMIEYLEALRQAYELVSMGRSDISNSILEKARIKIASNPKHPIMYDILDQIRRSFDDAERTLGPDELQAIAENE